MKKYTFLLLIFFIVLSLGLSGIALYRSEFLKEEIADAGGFGVSPPVIRAGELKTGESFGTTITALRSESGYIQHITLRVDAAGIEDWLVLTPGTMASFEANAFQAPISIAINVPKDAPAGEYEGRVYLSNIANSSPSGGVGILLGARVDVRFSVASESGTFSIATSATAIEINDTEIYQNFKGSIIRNGTSIPAWYVSMAKPELIPILSNEAAIRELQNSASLVEKFNLNYISVGVIGNDTEDRDSDGLPDYLEHALGTNPDNIDTDEDSYSDRYEIANGFSPFVAGTVTMTNDEYAGTFAGLILWTKEDRDNFWYVLPTDSKRYLICQDCNIEESFLSLAMPFSQADWAELVN